MSSHPQPHPLALAMSRRQFLAKAAALGVTVTAASAYLAVGAPTVSAGAPAGGRYPPATPFRTGRPAGEAAPKDAPAAPRALASEDDRVAHLLWRAGFGASAAELARFRGMGLQATIDHLVDFEGVDDSALEARLAEQEFDLEGRVNHIQRWQLQRMAYTERPLQEKMTLFWHGILTSSRKKTGAGPQTLQQNELFRSQGMGRYTDLLKAVSRDPAMMVYLDSRSNRKAAPNENYSRELMELFTLGIGHFSEEDVRESARAFTGWQLRRKREFRFNKRHHDFGEKTFLGQTGAFDGDDVVDIIMAQPAAADYICRRLWRFFAYDDPEPAVVARLSAIFRAHDTEIRPVVRAMLESDEFYSDRAVGAHVKSPVELAVGAVRALEVSTNFAAIARMTDKMGQALFVPPNVAGWPGGAAWINSSALLQRINFANAIAGARSNQLRFDPVGVLGGHAAGGSGALVDFLGDLLLGARLRPEQRAILAARLDGLPAASNNARLRSAAYLVLASPDFQLV